jgi:hypothetical protein
LPERIEALANSGGRRLTSGCTCADDQVDGGQLMLGEPERFANYATKSVASDGISDHSSADREAEPRAAAAIRAHDERKTGITEAAAVSVSGFEVGFAQNPARRREARPWRPGVSILNQGISFLRPLARRRASTLRPLAVAMRARNPCVRALRTLLGW